MWLTKKMSAYFLAALLAFALLNVSGLYSLNSGFKLVSFGDNYTEIEFEMPEYEMMVEDVDGVEYHKLIHFNAGYILEEGMPEVITFSTLLGVPNRGTVKIASEGIVKLEKIEKINLFPSQGGDLDISEERGFLINEGFYQKDVDYPSGVSMINAPGTMRDVRLVSLTVKPVVYNPARQELTIRKKIRIRVEYNFNEIGENEITEPRTRLSRSFEKLYQRNLINYEQLRNPATRYEYQEQSLLVVYNHSASILTVVNQYLDWKRDKGWKVAAVSTQNYQTATALQNYIQTAYNTWPDPPEHIVLIGSGFNESIPVPYHVVNGLRGDYPYTLLAGGDDLPDAFVGRVSAGDANGVAVAWNKIRHHERTPYMVETNWYEHSLVVGDQAAGYTGISAIIQAKLVKEMMKNFNPNYAVTEIIEAPYPNRMNDAINQGITFFSFRGSVSYAGWTPQEGSLNNGYKVCHATLISCGSLNLEGTARAEQFFRMGTPQTPKGAISTVGMTTSSTTTAFNNCMNAGIFYSIFSEGVRTMGEALVEGKLNLYRVYGSMHSNQLPRFTQQTTLIGDSSMNIWCKKPQTMNVNHAEQLPRGSNSIVITVTDENDEPIEDAWVTIRQAGTGEDKIRSTGYTDSSGRITHFFEPTDTGEISVVATKNDHKTYLGNFSLDGTPAVGIQSVVYNEDLIAGEEVNFVVNLKNHRTAQAAGVSGSISSTSPYVQITSANSDFGNIASGGVKESNSEYVMQLAPDAPAGHEAMLNMTVTDNAQNSWESKIRFKIQNSKLKATGITIIDGNNGILEPLEVADLRINLRNDGEVAITNLQGELGGNAYGLTITDNAGSWGNINPGQTVSNTNNTFTVSTTAYVIPGSTFILDLRLFNNQGFEQILPISIEVGIVTVRDPLGPDSYGYWIYDTGDEGYIEKPEYDWIEICETLGGPGTNTGLVTDWDDNQRAMTMDLPFTFSFYGEEYDNIGICPNGWLSPGGSEQGSFRNGRLPGNLGPKPIIAPMWENFSTAQGGVYTYYDEEQHIFIVQWQNMLNVMGSAPNTFQAILYDPVYYYTTTFDGPIKFQYKVFNNTNNGAGTPGGIGNWGNYASVGIANKKGDVGIEYTFNNRYPTAAKTITNESALYITTGLNSALVSIDSFWITDDNNNLPEYGETFYVGLRLSNIGVEDAPGVTATATTTDPYLTIIENVANFGDVNEDQNVVLQQAFTMRLAENVPHKHRSLVKLLVTSEDNLSWNYDIYVDANAPLLASLTPYVFDPSPDANGNGMVDPGERLTLYLPVKNEGGSDSPPVDVELVSESPLVTIHDISESSLNYIKAGEAQYPAVDISISNNAVAGSGLRFSYTYTCGQYTFEGQFLLGVGGIVPIELGTGTATTGPNEPSPINIYYRSSRTQSLYLASELQDHGIFGEFPITQIGFWVAGAPVYPLINFQVRMKHTIANDCTSHDNGPFTTVYTPRNYAPTDGNWDMLPLSPPFNWNGEDNILVDTAFSPVEGWNSSGQVRIHEVENAFRFGREDDPDQTSQETKTVSSARPHIMLMMGIDPDSIILGPRNLVTEFFSQTITLNWDPPQRGMKEQRKSRRGVDRDQLENRNPDGYNVYRNGIKLNENLVTNTHYNDTDFDATVLNYYYVTAMFGDTESLPSNIVLEEFEKVNAPIITPEDEMCYGVTEVTMTSNTPDAVIYYTLNGEEPTEDDILYQGPFLLDYDTIIKAKGFREDWVASNTSVKDYKFLYSPQGLTGRSSNVSVTLYWEEPWSPDKRTSATSRRKDQRDSISDCILRREVLGYNVYRSDNEEDYDKLNEELYEYTEYADLELDRGIYYYYVTAVYEIGESMPSEVLPAGVGYVTQPLFEPQPGQYFNQVEVTLSCHTHNAIIFYTLDGTRPTESSNMFSEPIIIDKTTTVKAFAIKTDWIDSGMINGHYVIEYTSTEDEEEVALPQTELLAAYPNPFNPSTNIAFNLKEAENVTIEIYNIIGKKVKVLVNNSPMSPGRHNVVWKGDDDNGKRVGSGIYLYKMTAGEYAAVKKIVMLK